jgi:PAS domain S-box-containing protein
MSQPGSDIPVTSSRRRLAFFKPRASWVSWVRSVTPFRFWAASGLLAAGLIVTVLVSLYIRTDGKEAARHEFEFTCNEIRLNIADRLDATAQILRSGAALFDASQEVTREEWRVFTERLRIAQHLPGIQGIGFTQVVPREQLTRHVEEIRLQGFPNYRVRPGGEREIYTSILYLEPFSGRNLRAFGYDMFSEPVRRAAMERARDENTAALSGKVTLVQETDEDVQAGTLMYVPVYRHGMPIETVEQRRAALQGWVYSPYRMRDLIQGTLRGWDVKQKDRRISLQIYDGDELTSDTLLYDSQTPEDKASIAATVPLTQLTPVVSAGHRWTLRFVQIGGLMSMADSMSAWIVLLGGTVINLLLFGLLLSLFATRANMREARRLTAELRQSEERYRQLFESASDALFLIASESGEIVEANSTAIDLYGYDREELLAKRIVDLSAEPEKTLQFLREMKTLPGRTVSVSQRLHFKKDGAVFPVEVNARSFTWKGQSVLFVSARDITERKRAEEQFLQLQKAESLGRMAGASAHHFNNQLSVVMGNLDIALEDLPRREDVTRYLKNAMEAARKAAEVSGLMLTYLGQTVGKREPLDLSATCSRSLPILQRALPKGVTLKTDLAIPGPVICGNANQMQQVLSNLITNAWEAMGGLDGAIQLSVKTVPPEVIPNVHIRPVSWQPAETSYACLEVTDTGCGIAAADLEKIFDPFFSSKFPGRGLGLPVVLGIVKVHDGVIAIESKPEQGSVFRVFFPLSPEPLAPPIEKPGTVLAGKGNGTILLVEDEEAVLATSVVLLKRLGFSVRTAADGIEAVEVFQKYHHEISVVLCDLTMPRMNGWETLAALRQIVPGVPVILASGHDPAQVLAGDHPERPQAFLHKPYRLAGLREALERAMGTEQAS